MNGEQCKMARAALGISTHDLATLADVGRVTVVGCEAGENIAAGTRAKIRSALIDSGVQFRESRGRVSVTIPEQFSEQAELVRGICDMIAEAKRLPIGFERQDREKRLGEMKNVARALAKVQALIAANDSIAAQSSD